MYFTLFIGESLEFYIRKVIFEIKYEVNYLMKLLIQK